jgi:queuine tRNA-ribosyltransferase
MIPSGRLNLMNAVYARDPRPILEGCRCYTCQHFTRAYLRHLIVAKEMLAATLISIHNLFTLEDLMRQAREAIIAGRYSEFSSQFFEQWLKKETV